MICNKNIDKMFNHEHNAIECVVRGCKSFDECIMMKKIINLNKCLIRVIIDKKTHIQGLLYVVVSLMHN